MAITDTRADGAPNETIIGETRRTPRDYFIRVSRLYFTERSEGVRVRLTLLKGTQVCRSLDFTPGLLDDLIRLLIRAHTR